MKLPTLYSLSWPERGRSNVRKGANLRRIEFTDARQLSAESGRLTTTSCPGLKALAKGCAASVWREWPRATSPV
jgi:hypothetical protein